MRGCRNSCFSSCFWWIWIAGDTKRWDVIFFSCSRLLGGQEWQIRVADGGWGRSRGERVVLEFFSKPIMPGPFRLSKSKNVGYIHNSGSLKCTFCNCSLILLWYCYTVGQVFEVPRAVVGWGSIFWQCTTKVQDPLQGTKSQKMDPHPTMNLSGVESWKTSKKLTTGAAENRVWF